MKIVSFNVNSVRMRLHQLHAFNDKHAPDIIGLQETKVTDEDYPFDDIQELGFESAAYGQKTHYGVALLSKIPATKIETGFINSEEPKELSQKRMIIGHYTLENGETLKVLNGYFPQGESRDHPVKFPYKATFYRDLLDYLNNSCSPTDNVIVLGDFNVSPEDIDIGIGEDNRKRWLRQGKTSFLPEEREWLQAIKDWGLYDTFEQGKDGADPIYSWFDYRSKGFDREPKRGLRIDYILATKKLKEKVIASGIEHDVRSMVKPSDHCPVWTEFDL